LALRNVARRSALSELSSLLDSPEVAGLVSELDGLRWTGRKGYGACALVGACLPTWTRTARLIREHEGLREVLGQAPSEWSLYRFTVKLRQHASALADCLDRIAASLADALPELGRDVALDASDMAAYSNGQRYIYDGGPEQEKFSDETASWGHRSAVGTRSGGGFFGFKLHLAACARTGLPLAWQVETGRANESQFVGSLLDRTRARGFAAERCALDRGYDVGPVYDACEERDCRPIVPLRNVGKPHEPPTCEHGIWTFAGADFKRKRTKWRCPSGACSPASSGLLPTGATRSCLAICAAGVTCTGTARPSSASSGG
jgi:Transposase DDE domain